MNRFLFLVLLLVTLLFHGAGQADDDDVYVDTGQWQVSLALGYGSKSNPLVGGDDLSLVVLPEFAYYGEQFYFDNGDLGYTFIENERFALSALTRLNIERAYFSYLHPSNILVSNAVADQVDSGDVCIECSPDDNMAVEVKLPSIDDLAKRDYAIDAGIQANFYLGQRSMIRAEVMQDVSGVYKGQNAQLEYISQHLLGDFKLGLSLGLRYKSRKLVDYYYGLDNHDDVDPVFYYQAEAAIQPFVKLTGIYPVDENWSVVALARYSHLGSGMADSPVVEDNSTATYYLGASYGF